MPYFDGLIMSGLACAVDPNAASRVLLLRGQGADATTPATDDLGNALTWSGAQISTAQTPWPSYGSSIRIASPSTTNFVSGPRGTNFALPGDFTMRARVRLDSVSNCTVFAHEAYNGAENGNYVFRILSDGIEFRAADAGGANVEQVIASGITINSGAFMEVEASRISGFLRLAINGNVIASGTLAKSLGSTSNNAVRIGVNTTGGTVTPAYFADAVILKGVGAHNSSYTPDTSPPC